MLRTPLRILLVDDSTIVENDVRTSLSNNGFDPHIQYVAPTNRSEKLCGCDLPNAKELAEFDLALVDLELFYPIEHTRYRATDLQGGTIILPYLRKHAPWLPVVAESQLLLRDRAKECLPLAGSFGFDGLIARDFFVDDATDRQLWVELQRSAELRRLQSVVGDEFRFDKRPHVRFTNTADEELLPEDRSILEAVGTTFHFAHSVTLDELIPGFSGARVFRATVMDDSQRNHAGFWAVKTSQELGKLADEARAHLDMMRAGHEFAVAVPMLWHGVVVRERVGVLAYHFAADITPAASRYIAHPKETAGAIRALVERFHGAQTEWTRHNASPREVVRDFGPSNAKLASAVAELSPACKKFYSRLQDDTRGVLASSSLFSSTRIHGDLHLDNILIGDRSVLIDFARSGVGPRAVDYARLYVDFFRILDSKSRDPLALLSEHNAPIFKRLGALADMFRRLDPDDGRLFDILTWTYVVAFIAYDDTDALFRTWLLREIPKLTRRLQAQLDR